MLALQKASSTPHVVTQQNAYDQDEDQGRIWLEFMTVYYGKRTVDMAMTDEMRGMFEQANTLAQQAGQPPMEIPDTVPVDFDFGSLRDHEMNIQIDAGASSYYSEIASMETLSNLLDRGVINGVQFLERVPDGHITRRLELIAELKEQMRQQEEMQQAMLQQQMAQVQAQQAQGGGAPGGASAPGGGGPGDAVETSATAERRTTGFKELGEALRRVERGLGWRQSAA